MLSLVEILTLAFIVSSMGFYFTYTAQALGRELGRQQAFKEVAEHCADRERVCVELSARGELLHGLVRAQVVREIGEEVRGLAGKG